MAASKEVVVNEEDLCCYICLELYDKPRTLPCLHSFCHICLVGYTKRAFDEGKQTINCPICRADLKRVGNVKKWVENLPINFTLVSILRNKKMSMSNVGNKCDQCLSDKMETSATVYCYECSEKLCEKCTAIHKKVKLLSGHRLCNIENKQDDVAKLELLKSLTRCPEHPSEEVRYICTDHDQLCCNECAIVSHRKCNQMVSIAKEQAKTESAIEGTSDRLTELTKYLEKLIEYEDQHQSNIAACNDELKDKLKDIKKRIDDAFREMEKAICDEFKEKSRLILKESGLQKTEIESLKSEVELSTDKMETAKEFGQPLHLFLIQRILRNEIKRHEGKIRCLNDKMSKRIVKAVEQSACNELEQKIADCLRISTKCSDAKIPTCQGIMKFNSWLEAVKSSDNVSNIQKPDNDEPNVKTVKQGKELDTEQEYEESEQDRFEEEFEDDFDTEFYGSNVEDREWRVPVKRK
ncbi:tripartite motif-containing protein 45-like [Mercenaria mercenaria]|uniref:tripartite motif-containing protein 45-like n=1 Tax=Mercenaria mercenaria TaxID=6596 RepID=UPI00234E458F|nr:tripartite motif-containing protein 45-like [Mercenaria mercenaria]